MTDDGWIYDTPQPGAPPPAPAPGAKDEWIYSSPTAEAPPAQAAPAEDWTYSQPAADNPNPDSWSAIIGGGARTGVNQGTSGIALGAFDANLISSETASGQMATDAADIAEVPIPPSVTKGAMAYKALEANPNAGWTDNFAFWYNNPEFAAWIMAQGMGQSVGQMAGQALIGGAVGAVTGPGAAALAAGAATVGALSTFQDYTASLQDELAAKGFDTTDMKSLEHAYANPEFIAGARERAAKHGVAVGFFDALTSLIAPKIGGKVAGLTAKADSILARAAEHSAAYGVELGGAGAGQAAGDIWSTGTTTIPSVLSEVVGEAGPGAVDVGIQTLLGGREHGTATNTPPSEADFGAAGAAPAAPDLGPQIPPELRIPTADVAATEGRTMYGFSRPEDPKRPIEVRSNYTETEAQLGADENRFSRMVAVSPDETVMSPQDFVDNHGKMDLSQAVKYEGNDQARAQDFIERAISTSSEQEAAEMYVRAVKAGARVAPLPGAESGLYVGDPASRHVLNWEADPVHGDMQGRAIGADSRAMVANPNTKAPIKEAPWYDTRVLRQRLGDRFYPERYKSVGGAVPWGPHVDPSSDPQVAAEFAQRVNDPGQSDTSIRNWVRSEVERGTLKFDLNSQTFYKGGNFVNTEPAEIARAFKAAKMKNAPLAETEGMSWISQVPAAYNYSATESPVLPGTLKFHQNVATVLYEGGSPSERLAQKTILAGAKLISQLMKRFGMKNSIVIHYPNGGAPKVFAPGTPMAEGIAKSVGTEYSQMAALSDGTIHLIIGSGHTSPLKIYRVLAHEFGHAIAYTKFSQASAHVRAQIFAAYRRFLLSHGRAPTREFFQRRRVAIRPEDDNYANRLRMGGDMEHYGVSFEEWFAEQVSRWMQTDRSVMGAASHLMREIGHAVLEGLKAFWAKFPGSTFRPEREMESWLRSMWAGETRVDWAPQARAFFQRETVGLNEKWFGEGAQELQPETVGLRQVIADYGPMGLAESTGPPSGGGPTPQTPAQSAAWLGAHADKFTWFHKWTYNIQQLSDKWPGLRPLTDYRSYLQLMQNMANKIMGRADARVRDWRALGSDMGGRLTAFIIDLDQGEYLSPAEKKAGVRRHPTPAEQLALAQKHGVSAEAVKVYKDDITRSGIHYDFQNVIDETENLAVKEAMKITDPLVQAQAIADAKKQSAHLKSAPYFPHTRFGTWTVTVKVGGKLMHFATTETRSAQKKLGAELGVQYGAQNVKLGVLPEDVRQFVGMPSWMMDRLMLLPGLTPAQKDFMEQLRNETAPASSHRKHMMKRNNYAGFSREGMRVYSKYFFHWGRQFARLNFQDQLNEQVQALKNIQASGDVTTFERIGNYLEDHFSEVMNPSKDWALLRTAAAIFHLGFVPASAALNLMQTIMVTGPFLGAKFGDAKALAAMGRAVSDVKLFYRKENLLHIPGDKFEALSMALEDGLISESLSPDLAAVAQGGRIGGLGFGQTVRERWVAFSEKAMLMFHLTEQFNRRVTFSAAWELAMEADPNSRYMKELGNKYFLEIQNMQKLGGIAGPMPLRNIMAYMAAKDAVKGSQYTMDAAHRARFMRGKVGALTQFYGFMLNTMLTMWNNKTDVMPRMLLTMMVLAGPLGVIPDDIEDLVNFIIRKTMGKDFNVEREAREIVSGIVGSDWADSVLLGASRNSFGIPWLMDMAGVSWAPRLDMSKSIALSRILPIDIKGLLEPGADFNKTITDTTQSVAGAAFGPAFALMQAVASNDLNWYDFKRWETAMPRALRSASRAIRNGYEGAERDRNYNATLDFDYTDHQHFAELAAMALGFNPTRRAQYYDRMRGQMEHDAFWQVAREGLMRRAFQSRALKMEEWSGVVSDIRDYNKNVPDAKRRITPAALKESLQRRMKMRAQKENPPAGSLDTIYPEVERHAVR